MNFEKQLDCLGQILDLSPEQQSALTDETLLEPLGLDSIRFIQYIVLLEEELGIEIRDSDLVIDKFATPQAIRATMAKYFPQGEQV